MMTKCRDLNQLMAMPKLTGWARPRHGHRQRSRSSRTCGSTPRRSARSRRTSPTPRRRRWARSTTWRSGPRCSDVLPLPLAGEGRGEGLARPPSPRPSPASGRGRKRRPRQARPRPVAAHRRGDLAQLRERGRERGLELRGRVRRRRPAARCRSRCPDRCRSSPRPSRRRRTRTRTRAASSRVPSTSVWRGQMPITPPQVRVPTSGPSFISLKLCEKMSPSEPACSLVSATTGPSDRLRRGTAPGCRQRAGRSRCACARASRAAAARRGRRGCSARRRSAPSRSHSALK